MKKRGGKSKFIGNLNSNINPAFRCHPNDGNCAATLTFTKIYCLNYARPPKVGPPHLMTDVIIVLEYDYEM